MSTDGSDRQQFATSVQRVMKLAVYDTVAYISDMTNRTMWQWNITTNVINLLLESSGLHGPVTYYTTSGESGVFINTYCIRQCMIDLMCL